MTRRFRPTVVPLEPPLSPAVFGTPWPDPNLTLSFAPDGTDIGGQPSRLGSTLATLPPAARVREVLRAFQSWVDVAGVNVGLVADGGQPAGTPGPAQGDPRFGDIRVAAVPVGADAAALGLPFDITAGGRAGDVVLNSNLAFGSGGSAGFDLYGVALHEAGHVFGLDGTADPASALFQGGVAPHARLSASDVANNVALYGPRAPDAYEGPAGNGTPATAARLQPQGGQGPSQVILAAADLAAASDVDVYSFRPSNLGGGALTLTIHTAGLSLLVPRVELLDANGAVLASGVGAGPGAGDVTLRLPGAVEGATYFARVTSADPDFAAGAYTLEARPEADAPAPPARVLPNPDVGDNDSIGRATQLGQQFLTTGPRADYALRGTLDTPADVDYYRLRSPQGPDGPMTVTLYADAPGGTDPVAQVFDERGQPMPVQVVAHDGGTTAVQVASVEANKDYYVLVRHGAVAAPGGYTLGVDFGGRLVALPVLAAGALTPDVPAVGATLRVAPSQLLHLVLGVGPAAGVAVRLDVFDAAGALVASRSAPAGDSASLNAPLAAGDYRLVVSAFAPGSGPALAVGFSVAGLSVSDPVGPRAVPFDPAGPAPPAPPPPPPPPQPTVGPLTPLTPVPPVQPSPPPTPLPPAPPPVPPVPPANPGPVQPVLRPLPRVFGVGGAGGKVRTFNPDGTALGAPATGLGGGVRVAEADFTGDGVADLVVGSGPGSATSVRILDGATQRELFNVAPFEGSFTGGVFVAAGDLDGDGVPELVVTPDEGGGPRVRVFSGRGFGVVADFFGIDDPNFRGGARAAVGDLNGDGVGDLLVSAGFGGGPRVAGYDGRTLSGPTPAHLFGDFFAFEATLRNGAYLAAGDIDGDGRADLVAGAGPGGGPRVTVFGGAQLLADTPTRVADFFAGDPSNRGGVPVAVKDLDGDARADVVAGSGPGGPALVFGYSGQTEGTLPELFSFDAFPGDAGGVSVG